MLSSNEMVNERVTELLKIRNGWRWQLAKPNPCSPFEGGREWSADNLVWGLLQV